MPLLDPGDVDSRLTATLQAVLTTSHFLDREDAAPINKAIRTALDSAATAIAVEVDGRHSIVDLQGGSEPELRRAWAGPNLTALSLLALLHVSQNRWEGIPAAIDVLQEMVSDLREQAPPCLTPDDAALLYREPT